MAYQKQRERILAGSLNLLTPTDLTPEADSVQMQNWRVDQVGALRSRLGMYAESIDFGAPIHTFFRTGPDRYAGVGGSIYHGGALMSDFVDSGYSGDPLGFAAYQGFVWVMNGSRRRKVSGVTASAWGAAAPAAAPNVAAAGGAGNLTGEFVYYVTFSNDWGHESAPSPESATLTLAAQNTQLTGIPVAPAGNDVNRRHIYRVGGGQDAPLRVLTLNDNVTTSAIDNVTVEQQQRMAITMPLDNDLPPAAFGLIGPYFGRLIAYRSTAHPERFWWSKVGQPHAWPGAADDFEGNWNDCGEEQEAIVRITHHNRLMVIYKEKSIWRLQGDPDRNDPERTSASLGAISERAVVSVGNVDYFAGVEGIYRFNMDREEKISVKIDPIFKGETARVGDATIPPLNKNAQAACVMGHRGGRLYFSYPSGSATSPNVTLVYDIDGGRWYHHTLDAASYPGTGFTALYDEGSTGALLGGALTGAAAKLYALEVGATDATVHIPLRWQSKFYDQGLPDNEKVYADLTIDYQTAYSDEGTPTTLQVDVIYDNGADPVVAGTISSAGRTAAAFALGVDALGKTARNAAVRLWGNARTTVIIHGVYLHYYVEPRWSRTWDTGVTDLGSRQVKKVEALELDLVSTANLTLTVQSDAGGTLGAAIAGTVASTAGARKTMVIPLDPPPAGYTVSKARDAARYRVALSAAAGQRFKLYGARLKTAPYGLVVTADEPWDSLRSAA